MRSGSRTHYFFLIPLQVDYCPCPRATQAARRSHPYGSFSNPANMIDVLFCPIDSRRGSCKLMISERI